MTSWGRWRPEIAKAAISGHQTIEGIDAELATGRAKLWATDSCCMVVEFHVYPGGARSCQVTWVAGDMDALTAELPKLEAEAKALGCTEMLFDGRPGWGRVLRNDGYRLWSTMIRKEL